jgi:gamma-glutamylcyclotransferase (GGCT)/AIG2-like uncharacterized protein YtfP
LAAASFSARVASGDPKHFFFYGTLQAEQLRAQARQILPKLTRLGEAFTPGRLFAIKALHLTYPALIEHEQGRSRVAGICYAIRPDFTKADLKFLDAYEDYFPDKPERSEYLRKALPIELKTGARLSAWVYVYNYTLPKNAEPIPSGDFKDYIVRMS